MNGALIVALAWAALLTPIGYLIGRYVRRSEARPTPGHGGPAGTAPARAPAPSTAEVGTPPAG